MKIVAVLAGVACVFAGTSFSSAATTGTKHAQSAAHWPRVRTSLVLPAIGPLGVRRAFLPMQTDATATPTASPQPSPSATSNPAYPDPVTLLQSMFNIYGLLNGVHFDYITDGDQQGTVSLHIDAVGDANCKGPSLKATVKAKETLEGTQQSQTQNYSLIQVKNSYYIKSKSTKSKWTKSTATKAAAFSSFTVDNPLVCPNATTGGGSGSGSGSTGGGPQIKDLTNLGPDTVAGVSVWHVEATEVDTDPQTGQTSQATVDYYLGQQHPLPYKYSATVNDTQNGVKLVFQQILSKFGEKVTIKAPKIGSTKP